MVSGCTVSPDIKKSKLGSSEQEASLSAGAVLVPCRAWKCVPTATSSVVDVSEVPGCHLLREINLSEGHRNYFKD